MAPLGAARFGLSGGALDLGSLELIETISFSGASTVDFDDLGSNYNVHLFTCSNVNLADNRDQNVRVKVGGTVQTGASDYARAYQINRSDDVGYEDKDPDLNRLRINAEIGAATGESWNGYMYMYYALDSGRFTHFTQHLTQIIFYPHYVSTFGNGLYQQTNTLSGVQFSPSSSTMTGKISLYGIKGT